MKRYNNLFDKIVSLDNLYLADKKARRNKSSKDNYQVFKVEDRGISFVGYVIRHDYTLVRKNIKRSMCRKAARLGRKKNITVEDYKQEMCSHIGWLKHCNGINLLKKILRYKELLVYARRFSKQRP